MDELALAPPFVAGTMISDIEFEADVYGDGELKRGGPEYEFVRD